MRPGLVTSVLRALPLLVALAASGCGLQQDLSQRPAASGPSNAPAIAAATLSGRAFDWSAVRGHPLVLDFWASWCGPCRAEQKDLNAIASAFMSRGVVFVGVDMRDDDAAARAYESDFHVPYESVVDEDERISSLYDVAAPPTLVIVDASGRIVDRFLGTVVGVRDELRRLS
jgi:thiol-disulfide isomerase/thioredoxin